MEFWVVDNANKMWFKSKIRPEKIKIKNTKKLRSNGIDVPEHLPYLDDPEFREPQEIARRMMVLLALFQLHLEAPVDIVKNWIDTNGLTDSLTEEEKEFLKSNYKGLPERDQINIYWFVEAIWTFAWIGGMHDKLTFNSGVEDTLASMLPNIAENEPTGLFIAEYKLRSKFEIFDMLDKFYRVHWFARNNNLAGKTSDKVSLDLVMERRKALEFVCYAQVAWDEISLDT